MRYDRDRTAAFYDEYGEREWTRFFDGRTSPVSVSIHAAYLRRFITPGSRVLDAGAGPGRFTIELARIGARVTVADLSAVQLQLNRRRVTDAGLAASVDDWVIADICDLSAFADDAFDAVVCYGGPLSYVLDRAQEALAELFRVARPGGHVLLSVMSLVGATKGFLPTIIEQARRHGAEAIDAVIRTGDLPSELSGGHLAMHMYRWSELEGLLSRFPCHVVAASASSLSYGAVHQDILSALTDEEFDRLVEWELDLAAERGAVSSGEHIIAVVEKTKD